MKAILIVVAIFQVYLSIKKNNIASVKGNSEQVYDIFDMNEIWHEAEEHRKYFFFGENNISWFVFSLTNKKFYELDMPSGDIIEVYENFNSILDDFFEQAI